MRIATFFLLFALPFCVLNAQETFVMERYLATAFTDQELERYQAQLNFLDENNYNAAWVRNLELRVGSEDANASLNDYRLRLSPTNPAEIKANKKYYTQQLNVLSAQQKIATSEALMNRYGLLIDLAYLQEKQRIAQDRLTFQNLIIKDFSSGADQNLNLKDFISVQAEQSKNLLRLEEIESLLAQTWHYIVLDYTTSSTLPLTITKLIKIEQITKYIAMPEGQAQNNNLEAEVLKEELELGRLDYNIEKAEAWSNIGYIQSNIDTERGDTWTERVGFQLGVRLPISNPDRPSLNRQRVKLLEDEAEAASKLIQLEQEQKLNDMLLQRLLNRHQLILERIAVIEAIPVSGSSQVDWNQILALKNYQLQLLEEKAETEKQIREAYINSINTRGLLVGTPIINYLSETYSPIEIF